MILENFKENTNESNYDISIDDSLGLVVESYINDYTIFEAVLRRDFYELIREQEEEKKEDTEENKTEEKKEGKSNKNFFVNIWENIVKAFKWLRDKISGLINNIVNRIETHKQEKVNTMVSKYKPLFDKGEQHLKDFTYKCKEMKDFNVSIKDNFNVVIPDFDGITEDSIKSHMEKMTDVKKIKEKMNGFSWGDEIEKPFNINKMKELIIKNIEENLENRKDIKELKNGLLEKIKEQEEKAKKKLKEAKRNKELNKEVKDQQVNLSQLYLKAVTATQKEITVVISSVLNIMSNQYKLSYKIYKSAGKYLEGKLGEKAKKPEDKDVKKEPNKSNGEIVDDGGYKKPETKEDFDDIRKSAVGESTSYYDALIEAEFYEYGL